MSRPHRLYVRHACEHCANAEALLQSEGIAYDRVVVEPSETPGELVLRLPDGTRERVKHRGYFATPTLVDVEAKASLVGFDSIEAHIDVL